VTAVVVLSAGWTYYAAFTEGWALYAENPLIARETKVYDNSMNLF